MAVVESCNKLNLMGLQPMKNVCMLHVACCSNLTIFLGKIKIGWKSPCLESSNRYTLFIYLFIYFLKTSFCFANIPFQFKNLLQKWKLVSLSISFSGFSGHILEKNAASTKKREGIFFLIFQEKRGSFFQIEGAHFFHDTLMHEMRKIGRGSTNRSKH